MVKSLTSDQVDNEFKKRLKSKGVSFEIQSGIFKRDYYTYHDFYINSKKEFRYIFKNKNKLPTRSSLAQPQLVS